MTDINKQIEEEARKILEKADKLPPEANYFGSVDHIKYSANDIIILLGVLEKENRWRKVSEGMPPILTDVLIKSSTGKIDVGCLLDDKSWGMTSDFGDSKVEFWKPID